MEENNNLIRLQKYIADCGVASRRKAEELILHKKVMVNQNVVTEMGLKINPDKDIVKVDGKLIKPENEKVYIMLNKPTGYITTSKDEHKRETVLELVKDIKYRIYPVGRLDYDTSGLLLLTNDGDFANKLIHPKFQIDKTYVVEFIGILKKDQLETLRKGVKIEDYVTEPAKVEIVGLKGNTTTLNITIHQGKNRQVRKMFEAVGHKVTKLKRVFFGNLSLGKLKEGHWRHLSKQEVEYLMKL